MSEPKPKPFVISKRAVWEAWLRVKANKGAAGVDEQSIDEFEQDLQGNLFKLWNRLSSGSYLPPPVRAVEIPKRDGSLRVLGVPTVTDRIAQVVVRSYLESGWSRCSTRTRMGIGRGGQLIRRLGPAGSGVGATTGCSIWTSGSSWSHRHTACAFMGVVSKRLVSACGTSIRRPFRRPVRTWRACSSPRLTRCNTVWRETPRIRIASTIGI